LLLLVFFFLPGQVLGLVVFFFRPSKGVGDRLARESKHVRVNAGASADHNPVHAGAEQGGRLLQRRDAPVDVEAEFREVV
jgi:hypothetical protein